LSNTGTLYIVATPLGNLDDLSLRAQQVLKTVDKIAAEDTRHSRYLLNHYGIQTSCISLHDFNEQERTTQLLRLLTQGSSLALISDAGTPLISDPGYRLVQSARQQNIKVVPIPGPCALIAALSAAGLPSARFSFEGFLPPKTHARLKHLTSIKEDTRTLIFYESPHRILDTMDDMISTLGPERLAVIARELTKTFETIQQGSLVELKQWLLQDPNQQKGEFVVLVQGSDAQASAATQQHALEILDLLLSELPVSQAVKLAVKITGEKKSWLYEMALARKTS